MRGRERKREKERDGEATGTHRRVASLRTGVYIRTSHARNHAQLPACSSEEEGPTQRFARRNEDGDRRLQERRGQANERRSEGVSERAWTWRGWTTATSEWLGTQRIGEGRRDWVMSEAPWFNRTRRCAADWPAPLRNAAAPLPSSLPPTVGQAGPLRVAFPTSLAPTIPLCSSPNPLRASRWYTLRLGRPPPPLPSPITARKRKCGHTGAGVRCTYVCINIYIYNIYMYIYVYLYTHTLAHSRLNASSRTRHERAVAREREKKPREISGKMTDANELGARLCKNFTFY